MAIFSILANLTKRMRKRCGHISDFHERHCMHGAKTLGRTRMLLGRVVLRAAWMRAGEHALPLSVAQGADGACLEPARDAIKVEDVPAAAPRNRVARIVGEARIGLGLNGGFVQLVTADGARVRANVPRPEGDGVPLFYDKARPLLSLDLHLRIIVGHGKPAGAR